MSGRLGLRKKKGRKPAKIMTGGLLKKHSDEEPSGNEVRCIKSPPCVPGDEQTVVIGAHTDFGSLVNTVFSHLLASLTAPRPSRITGLADCRSWFLARKSSSMSR